MTDTITFERLAAIRHDASFVLNDGHDEYVALRGDDARALIAALEAATARAEKAERELFRLTPNPADFRYWEGRYRDEKAEVERLQAELSRTESIYEEEVQKWMDAATYEVGGTPQLWSERATAAEAEAARLRDALGTVFGLICHRVDTSIDPAGLAARPAEDIKQAALMIRDAIKEARDEA